MSDRYPNPGPLILLRGGVCLISVKLRKNADVASVLAVNDDEEIIIVTLNGMVIRQKVGEISVFGRSTMGVRLQRLAESDSIVAVALVVADEEAEEIGDDSLPLPLG